MDETKKIEKVIFVTDQKGACIFFQDNTVEFVSIDEGKKAATLLVKQDKIENFNLNNYNKIEFLNGIDLDMKYGEEIKKRKAFAKKSKENNPNSNFDETKATRGSGKFKIVNSIVTAGIILSLGTLAIGGYKVFNSLFGDKQITNDNDNDIDNDSGSDSLDNTIETQPNNVMNILNNTEINETRRKFLSLVFEYLCYYNNNFSQQHTDNITDTKAAIKWDEVVSQLLVYNKYNKQQIFDIFGYYDYDSSEMYMAFNEGQKQEKMAYIIQKEPLKKLFLNEEEDILYEKYEALNIKFNKQTTQEEKIKTATAFFTELRNDIDFDEGKISAKMIVISPILEAMMKKTHDSKLEGRLNSKELEFYRSYCDEKVREKLQKIENQLEDAVILNRNLGVVETSTYQEIEDIAIKQLEETNLYNVDEDQRDISDHEDYKKAISYFKNYTSKNEQNSDFNEYYFNNEEKNPSIIKNDNNNKNKMKSSVKSVKKTTKKEDYNVTSENDSSNDDIYDNSYIENEQNSDNNNYEYDNSYIDNVDNEQNDESINDDSNNQENIDYEENNEENNNSSNSSIYGDHIKDITTDPSGAVDHDEPLPDPNSITAYNLNIEEIADQAIEYISNINTSEPTESNKILIK